MANVIEQGGFLIFPTTGLRRQLELARFLKVQRWDGFSPPQKPSLDEEALARFTRELDASTGYLEFGSGGSTVLADRRSVRTVSVESDRFYARVVRSQLTPATTVKVLDVYLGLTGLWSYPVFQKPTRRRQGRWRRYVQRPFDQLREDGWFPDFVLVDGRFRRACVLETVRRAITENQELTLMVDDYFNVDRSHYEAVESWLGRPERVGRAALFIVNKAVTKSPTPKDVENAITDFR